MLKGALGDRGALLFSPEALEAYIIHCCQSAHGGLRDKPIKSRDYYHTCYCLSGLSSAQHLRPEVDPNGADTLRPIHPLHNVAIDKVRTTRNDILTTLLSFTVAMTHVLVATLYRLSPFCSIFGMLAQWSELTGCILFW